MPAGLILGLWWLLGGVVQADSPEPPPSQEPSVTEPTPPLDYHALTSFLAALDQADQAGFVPLTDWAQLGGGWLVDRDSEQWCGRFLSDVASPSQHKSTVVRTARDGGGKEPDFLRHRLQTPAGIPVEIVQTISHMLIRIGGPAPTSWAQVDGHLQTLLKHQGTSRLYGTEEAPYVWAFKERPALAEGVRFSTNPTDPMMNPSTWAARLDGGIQGGQLFFFGYKKMVPSDGRILFLSDRHWFDGTAYDAYR